MLCFLVPQALYGYDAWLVIQQHPIWRCLEFCVGCCTVFGDFLGQPAAVADDSVYDVGNIMMYGGLQNPEVAIVTVVDKGEEAV